MMKLFMENWLSVVVGIYLLGMVLYGHHKGFIRLVVSMLALVVSLTVVHVALPVVTGFLKENTSIEQTISDNMKKSIGIREEDSSAEDIKVPSAQRTFIENLQLPQNLKEALIENNNSEIYKMLGVDAFADYLGSYLSGMIINGLGFVLLFAVVYLAVRLIMGWLDIIAKLPILSGINKTAGALLGAVEGLLYLWIAFFVITAFSGTHWGVIITSQIEESVWLSFLYSHNFLNVMVLGVLQRIL